MGEEIWNTVRITSARVKNHKQVCGRGFPKMGAAMRGGCNEQGLGAAGRISRPALLTPGSGSIMEI